MSELQDRIKDTQASLKERPGWARVDSAKLCGCLEGDCMGDLRPRGTRCKFELGVNGFSMSKNPLDEQVGGNHYKDMAIQPIDYIMKNGIGYCEGNVIKYVTRWKFKNGVEDLKKARHYIDILIGEQDG